MHKILILAIGLFTVQSSFAQEQRYDWKSMEPNERKAVIQKMNPKERTLLLNQFKENMMVAELEVPKAKEEEFKRLYSEYQEKQAEIKRKFKADTNYANISDEDATKQIQESFEIGEQLLENRKKYAQKFMKVIKPQQVLQMYQTEGKMRNKILDKKHDLLGNPSSKRRRPR
jgi:hypothetical protein